MNRFTGALKTEWLDGRRWRVIESYRFYSGEAGTSIFVEVPRGFITDLASIPRAIRWLVPKVGRDSAASAVHDVLYRIGAVITAIEVEGIEHTSSTPISRGVADSIYHQALVASKVGAWRRKLLYHGVSTFGWIAWNRYRKNGYGTATETTL